MGVVLDNRGVHWQIRGHSKNADDEHSPAIKE